MKKIKNLLQNISQNRFFNITIIIIIIISLFSIIAYEGGIATAGLKIHYKTIEKYICIILCIEFLLRLWLSPTFKFRTITDILSFIPYYILPKPFSFLIIISRLIKITHHSPLFPGMKPVIKKRTTEAIALFIAILFVIFSFSIVIYLTEYKSNAQFKTIFDSLYWVIQTIPMLGYGDITPSTQTGKVVTIILVIIGVLILSIITSFITSLYMEYILKFKSLQEEKMKKEIKKLKNHHIICGFGRLGKNVAEELHKRDVSFVIIEKDKEKVENKGYKTICGDATEEETLKNANIEQASSIIILTPSDAENLYITMTARELNPNLNIISRVSEEESKKRLIKAGANKIISPYEISGSRIAYIITSPKAAEFTLALRSTAEEFKIAEIDIEQNSAYDGVKIKDSQIREKFNIMIIGIVEKGKTHFNPSAQTKIKGNSTLICTGQEENIKQFCLSVQKEFK